MENENGNADPQNGDQDPVIDPVADDEEVSALKEKYEKLSEQNKQLFARAKKAEGFILGDDGKWVKKTPENKPAPVEPPKKPEAKGELDDTALLLLEVKGIKVDDADEMKLVDEWRDTGKNVKQILTSRIFHAELKALRDEREVKNATPSSTKRGGSQTTDLAQALAKFEQTGELPQDFALRSAVVNAKADKENSNKPSWH